MAFSLIWLHTHLAIAMMTNVISPRNNKYPNYSLVKASRYPPCREPIISASHQTNRTVLFPITPIISKYLPASHDFDTWVTYILRYALRHCSSHEEQIVRLTSVISE